MLFHIFVVLNLSFDLDFIFIVVLEYTECGEEILSGSINVDIVPAVDTGQKYFTCLLIYGSLQIFIHISDYFIIGHEHAEEVAKEAKSILHAFATELMKFSTSITLLLTILLSVCA